MEYRLQGQEWRNGGDMLGGSHNKPDHWQPGSFQRERVHEAGVLGYASALAAGCLPHFSPNWEAVLAPPIVVPFLKQHMKCGWRRFLSSAAALAVPAGPVSWVLSRLLEPGDVSALLQVPDALVVILFWAKAMVTVGLWGRLLFLSV